MLYCTIFCGTLLVIIGIGPRESFDLRSCSYSLMSVKVLTVLRRPMSISCWKLGKQHCNRFDFYHFLLFFWILGLTPFSEPAKYNFGSPIVASMEPTRKRRLIKGKCLRTPAPHSMGL